MIVLISGAVLWLASEPAPEKPAPPNADITLAPPPAEKPAQAAHPAPPPAAAATPEPAAENPPEPAHPPTPPSPSPPAAGPTHGSAPPAPARTPEAPAPAKPATISEPPPDPTVVQPPAAAVARLPRPARSTPLPNAPDPEISEESPRGQLPVVGRDGREAWRVYARPFDPEDKRPKIAAVIYGLGSSAAATRSAIQGLPGAVTLAFTPYADQLPSWMAAARAAGHESLIMVPMEPSNYPEFDPGPQALLTSLSDRENVERLEWMLGRGVGYVGVASFMGSRFTGSPRHMRMFLESLKKRGLLFLESQTGSNMMMTELAASVNVPFTANRLYIDGKASRAAIDNQLREAEGLAKRVGAAVIMGFPYPVTLERVAAWAAGVEKRGFALAPVSALAARKDR